MIFVFGSNESGIHGAGAARFALTKGAVISVGFGLQGKTFAIPTKDWNLRTLELNVIKHYVDRFIVFAERHSKLKFQVTCIGCGLAGWSHEHIAPLFKNAPDNCYFDENWRPYLKESAQYWGSYG